MPPDTCPLFLTTIETSTSSEKVASSSIEVHSTDTASVVKLELDSWSQGEGSLTPRPPTLKKTVFTNRVALLFLFSVVAGVMLLFQSGLPPSYHSVRMKERALPQHRWGTNGRYIGSVHPTGGALKNREDGGQLYIRFPDHFGRSDDFSYVLQDALLKGLIAYGANRTFVFEDVVFSGVPLPFAIQNYALRPTRVPMGAFLGGWLAGQYKDAPRPSVSSEYFTYVCPENERVEITYHWPWDLLSEDSTNEHADGLDILRWWIHRLNSEDIKDQRCIVVRERERRIWHPSYLDSGRHFSLSSVLRHSPALKYFQWSNVVKTATQRIRNEYESIAENRTTFGSNDTTTTALAVAESAPGSILSPPAYGSTQMLEGVLSVHLPRARTGRRCVKRSIHRSGYVSWNKLLDGFNGRKTFQEDWETYKQISQEQYRAEENGDAFEDDLNRAEMRRESKQRKDYYLSRCAPSIPQIVSRLQQIRSEIASSRQGMLLTKVHVATDGSLIFMNALRQALLADGWYQVIETGDNIRHGYSPEEKGVSEAIDMAISEKAEAFLANGFSGLSANVVMMRLLKGISADSIFVF